MTETCIVLATILISLLLSTHAKCPSHQSRYSTRRGEEICCDYCAAGEEMHARCTPTNSKPTCRPCLERFYNPSGTNERCKTCNDCDTSAGSIVLKQCDNSSDAVCRCPKGSTSKNDKHTACSCEKGNQIVGDECVPCPQGYFSSEENSICRPWTNCTAKGEELQERGSATKNVKCSIPKSLFTHIPSSTTSTTTKSSILQTAGASQSNYTAADRVSINKTQVKESPMGWGPLSLILIGVILLLLSAGIILTMTIQMRQKERKRGFHRGQRCRLPVQEESSSESSLAKQCPA